MFYGWRNLPFYPGRRAGEAVSGGFFPLGEEEEVKERRMRSKSGRSRRHILLMEVL